MVADFDATSALIRAAQGGEQSAYESLFARYYPRVLRMVRSRMGDGLKRFEDPEDIVQNTFIEAVRNFEDFEIRHAAGLTNWFAKLVEHQVLSAAKYHGALKRDHGREVVLSRIREGVTSGRLCLEPTATGDAVVERVALAEQERILDECMSELPADYREVILLRDFAGGAWDWIAGQLGRETAGAARVLHRRAHLSLVKLAGRRLDC